MKNKILIVLILSSIFSIFSCLMIGSFIYSINFESNTTLTTSSISEESTSSTELSNILFPLAVKFKKIKDYFVFVSNYESNLSIVPDLTSPQQKLYAIENTDFELICEKTKVCLNNFILKNNIDEIYNELKSDKSAVAFIDFKNLDFRFKDLRFMERSILVNADYPIFVESWADEESTKVSNFDYEKLIHIGHTGSFIPARGVMLQTKLKFNNNLEPMISPMINYFSKYDFLSATQEISLKDDGIFCDSCMSFVGSEKELEQMIIPLGIDLVTMATNHILDGGFDALSNTKNLFEKNNLKAIGASAVDNFDALSPVLVEVKGLKIAYFAFNDTPGIEQWATNTKGGAASVSDWEISGGVTVKYEPNIDRIIETIDRAKALNPDIIIALPQWGSVEYQRVPTEYVQNLSNLLAANGVDIILGDHPHWIQSLEWKSKSNSINNLKYVPVVYSVGNFVFDQMWSEETRVGMTVHLIIYEKKVISLSTDFHLLNLYSTGTIDPILHENPLFEKYINLINSNSDL
jgi:hypothetical protein